MLLSVTNSASSYISDCRPVRLFEQTLQEVWSDETRTAGEQKGVPTFPRRLDAGARLERQPSVAEHHLFFCVAAILADMSQRVLDVQNGGIRRTLKQVREAEQVRNTDL